MAIARRRKRWALQPALLSQHDFSAIYRTGDKTGMAARAPDRFASLNSVPFAPTSEKSLRIAVPRLPFPGEL
jgi:hypothetical protein